MTSSRGPWERAQSLGDALRRAGAGAPPRRHATQIRTYDEAGRARVVDPGSSAAERLRDAAEDMIRLVRARSERRKSGETP